MANLTDQYTLLKELSENELTISYQARSNNSGSICFLKSLNTKPSALSNDAKRKILLDSWELQTDINSTYVNTATEIFDFNDEVLIQYPYLPPEQFQPLTAGFLSTQPEAFLAKITFLIDLLHIHNLVHTDIKLSNFLYDKKHDRVLLIDLDFITQKDNLPRGLLRGTEKHISPKIINNEILDKTVDYYSLGVMLEDIGDNQKLSSFIDDLKSQAPVHPFNVLGDGLLAHNFISEKEHLEYMRKLFGAYALSHYQKQKNNSKAAVFFSPANGIIGLNYEIATLIDESKLSKKERLYCLKSFIDQANISYIGSLWLLKTSPDADTTLASTAAGINKTDLFSKFEEFLESKFFYVAYLLGSKYLKQIKDQRQIPVKFFEHLIQLSYAFGEYNHCLQLIERHEKHNSPSRYLDWLKVACYMYQSNYELARQILNDSKTLPLMERYAIDAFIAMRRGEIKQAENLLEKASQSDATDESAIFRLEYYNLVLHAYKGNFKEAIAAGLLLEKKPVTAENESFYVSNLCMLANMSYEIGAYSKVITYCNKGLELCNTIKSFDKFDALYTALSNAYLRKTNYKKSLQFQLLAFQNKKISDDKNNIILAMLTNAHHQLRIGQYYKSKSSLLSLCQTYPETITRNMGKVYQNLVEVAWYTGDNELVEYAFDNAKAIYSKIDDHTSLEEVTSIYNCYNLIENNGATLKQLEKDVAQLFQQQSTLSGYRAVLVICLYCLRQNEDIPANLLDEIEVPQQQSPFNFLIHSSYLKLVETPQSEPEIVTLKALIPLLRSQKEYYFYSLVLDTIAQCYLRSAEHELAYKYFDIAIDAYQRINNVLKSKSLLALKTSKPETVNRFHQTSILNEISEVMTSIDNLVECYHNVLRLAIKLTKAERAVLLIKNIDDSSLRVKAAINCDDESLKEIEDYSKTLTHQAFTENETFIVDNALEDKELSRYKSIVKHNILSVIAIPLRKGDEILGVLYLDHHIIPALFNQEDILFTKTISNLFSLVISSSTIMQNYIVKNKELIEDLQQFKGEQKFITQDKAMLRLFEQLPRFAKSRTSILLLGESGTGKEILANMIHELSNRKDQPFIKVNAAAIPDKLLEAELFGIADKVATDVKGRIGKFEAADGGTLFIDEIGDLPLEVQAKLLRAIEYQEIERVGYRKPIRTDIRFIYATNKNLEDMVKEQTFRDDLYYRINAFPIHIPPLRERKGDVKELIKFFLKSYRIDNKPVSISPELYTLLDAYNWPGNVRELKNVIERLVLLSQGSNITLEIVPPVLKEQLMQASQIDDATLEKTKIEDALKRHKGVQSRAAQELNIPLSTFRRKLTLYKIS